jgi:hypothetical protein
MYAVGHHGDYGVNVAFPVAVVDCNKEKDVCVVYWNMEDLKVVHHNVT